MADETFMVERVEEGAVRRIEARRHSPLAPVSHTGQAGRRSNDGTAAEAFSPLLHFLDLPRFSSGDPASYARVAGLARPWRRILLSSSTGNEGYRFRTAIDRPARLGVTTAPLGPGAVGRFDRGGYLELDLFFGGLYSAEEQAVLNGENRIAVKADSGSWEVLGFTTAEEIAPNRWRIAPLLRGLAGTEDAMAAGAAAGAAVVVLDEAVVPLNIASDERGLSLNWLAESSSSSGGRAGPYVFSGGIRAETPLAPVHISGSRQANGSIHLSWIRRSRLDADDWDASEIPLDEPEERYRLEIMDGDDVLRAVETAGPGFTYDAADEIADFGTERAVIKLRITQMGRAVPTGIAATALVEL
jgi:hypothetical protein